MPCTHSVLLSILVFPENLRGTAIRRDLSNCQYLWIGVFQATSVSVC
ncbi:Uncharacterised protein [Mycobacteroides abscessus subsp. abscessus]|nr:Uncharacterised protein [Mycobacteroides abscessus subsp. abscessus]SHW65085.1 Uncharacterised protein [Mycobacteroides abscessus subsp. abscessus]SKK65821.1 Uncharacterised protein [Mycobacteroides abscessus subsp. abscessus]SKQ56419.1 Uncharacterised protein [Mycobacteroides abscessus subsp. abscessus]